MLSNPQKSLMKRAQREAGLNDEEYRHILSEELGFGVHSSTDPRLGDRHFDKFMAYLEAIYWRKLAAKEVPRSGKSVFSAPGYWSNKNTPRQTSRDRYAQNGLSMEIQRLESGLRALGCHDRYLEAIRRKTCPAHQPTFQYRAALSRTLAGRQKAAQPSEQPF